MTETQILNALHNRLTAHTWRTFSDERQPEVHLGRTFFDTDDEPLPVVTVIPGVESAERIAHGLDRITLPLQVTALVNFPNGQQAHLQARAIFLELKSVLYAAPLVIDFEPYTLAHQGGGFDYPEISGPADIQITVNCQVSFSTEHQPHEATTSPDPSTWASTTYNP